MSTVAAAPAALPAQLVRDRVRDIPPAEHGDVMAPGASGGAGGFWASLRESGALRQMLGMRLFWAALLVKVVLGSLLASTYARDLFVPFTNYYIQSGGHNPYAHFLALGRENSFPYAPIMLYALALPRLLFAPLLRGGTDTVTFAHLAVLRLPLLVSDLALLLTLVAWFPNRIRRVVQLYWCSPIVAYICYWHGQLDMIPTALFFVALYQLRNEKYLPAMALYGLALATKSHLIVALPFLLVYAAQQRGLRYLQAMLVVLAGAVAVGFGRFLFDPGFQTMVFGTAEAHRLLAFQISLGPGNPGLVVAPLALLLLFFRFAAYPKRNWDLLILYLAIAFSTFVVLIPPRPAYLLWSLPFTMVLLCRQDRWDVRFTLPFVLTNAAYFLFFWLGPQSDVFDAWRMVSPTIANWQTLLSHTATLEGLTFTLFQGCLLGTTLSIYLFGIRSNAVYRMRTRPVLIGIAGDSGSGKDAFTRGLTTLLDPAKTAVIAGDDYHRWPRGHEQWKVYSHLDVRGNDLHRQVDHAFALSSGNTIYKVHYDHDSGRFTAPQAVRPNHFVVFQGLHTLAMGQLRDMVDLRIFLDPQEDLRQLWKVQRDRHERGYTPEQVIESLRRRDADRQKYILSQRAHAELVVRWRPATPLAHDGAFDDAPALTLEIEALNSFNLNAFVEAVGAWGIDVIGYDPYVDGRRQTLELAGTISRAALTRIAQEIVSNLDEVTPTTAFDDDLPGCLQLITLLCLSAKLRYSSPAPTERANTLLGGFAPV